MNLLNKIQCKGYTIETLAERWGVSTSFLKVCNFDENCMNELVKDAVNGLPHYHDQTIYYRTSNFNYILIGAENGIGYHATVVMQGCFATNLFELARQSAFVVEEDVF